MTEVAMLEIDRVSKHFATRVGPEGSGVRSLVAVDSVSLQVLDGEALGIVGESGCGKTTLGRLMVNLTRPSKGTIQFAGENIVDLTGSALRAFRSAVQIVFQDPFGSLNPRLRIGDSIGEPLLNRGWPRAQIRQRVAEMLEAVGLSADVAGRYPHAFSGGQRQRIGIARALVVQPALLVCDEAVSALDVSVQAQILNLLADMRREQAFTLVFISHNLGVIRFLCSRIAVMYLGRIVELAPEKSLFEAPRHPYTQALIAAIPQPDPTLHERGRPLPGEPPSPLSPPSGCHFRLRCPHATGECAAQAPPLRELASDHWVACHHPLVCTGRGTDT